MMKEKVRKCFESILNQLTKENKKFQYKLLDKVELLDTMETRLFGYQIQDLELK